MSATVIFVSDVKAKRFMSMRTYYEVHFGTIKDMST